jgi:hypothetical protein
LWHFYKISVAKNEKVTVELTNLTADLDLYANLHDNLLTDGA